MSSEKVVQFADLGIYPYDDVGLSGFGDDLDFVTFGVFGVVADGHPGDPGRDSRRAPDSGP